MTHSADPIKSKFYPVIDKFMKTLPWKLFMVFMKVRCKKYSRTLLLVNKDWSAMNVGCRLS